MPARKDGGPPRLLLDRLGVKAGHRVSVLGVADESFLRNLRERTGSMAEGRLQANSDLIFYAADSLPDLLALSRLKEHIVSNGAIWVVSLKGKQARIKDVEVIAAAKDAGLVDNKVVSFSETHISLRLVIQLKMRNETWKLS